MTPVVDRKSFCGRTDGSGELATDVVCQPQKWEFGFFAKRNRGLTRVPGTVQSRPYDMASSSSGSSSCRNFS